MITGRFLPFSIDVMILIYCLLRQEMWGENSNVWAFAWHCISEILNLYLSQMSRCTREAITWTHPSCFVAMLLKPPRKRLYGRGFFIGRDLRRGMGRWWYIGLSHGNKQSTKDISRKHCIKEFVIHLKSYVRRSHVVSLFCRILEILKISFSPKEMSNCDSRCWYSKIHTNTPR